MLLMLFQLSLISGLNAAIENTAIYYGSRNDLTSWKYLVLDSPSVNPNYMCR